MIRSKLLEDPEATYEALWIAASVLLLWAARRGYGLILEGSLFGLATVTVMFVSALLVILLGLAGREELQQYGKLIGLWYLYLVLALAVVVYRAVDPLFFASDVALFESYASLLLLEGKNPLAADMRVALSRWDVLSSSELLTPTEGGEGVAKYSYPGGTLLISALEQWLFEPVRVGLFSAVTSGIFGGWLIMRSDVGLSPLVVLVWLAPVPRQISAALGLITPYWTFPLAVGFALWLADQRESDYLAAVSFGIAVAMKQLAGPPVLLILVITARARGYLHATRLGVILTGIGALIISPLLIMDPGAWLSSFFYPLTAELVAGGVGLTSLTVGGILEIPRGIHHILTFGALASLLGAAWLRPKVAVPLVPVMTGILAIVNVRGLPTYYYATLPLAFIYFNHRLEVEV